MTSSDIRDFAQALHERFEDAENPQPTRLATVTGRSGSNVLVRFDGESIASPRSYPRLHSVTPYTGDRVVLVRSGSSWVVVGVVAPSTAQYEAACGAAPGYTSGGYAYKRSGMVSLFIEFSGTGTGGSPGMGIPSEFLPVRSFYYNAADFATGGVTLVSINTDGWVKPVFNRSNQTTVGEVTYPAAS